ncbi:AAA family ATPase [Mucilaginibacter panaciglaebae]|uniref:AAA family ATPase n=1 Tax=Mucilaginibacter panaciglaebae TaxID=502331 RepID=A0ABP7WIR5_9SPHI
MNYNDSHTYFERPAEIELIRQMARGPLKPKQEKQLNDWLSGPPDSKDAFIIKPAAQFLHTTRQQADSAMLFGDFWYEGELCILFADTNVGKSILAVQIGDALSRGTPLPRFAMKQQASTVLYFDFELNDAQFTKRYTSDLHGQHQFGPNFYRVVFNPDADGSRRFNSYHEYINNALENAIVSSGARVIIIDNITCLRSSTQSAATAVNLMQNLQTIKNKYGLSVLVLAHTPKRNPAKPVTRNDLQGSKMLINFADSAFAIGESQTKSSWRYLKQIKQRSGSQVYGADNVYLCEIIKPYNNLHFDFYGPGNETDHLSPYTEQQRKHQEVRILQLHQQGRSIRQIAADTGISLSSVFRLVKKLGSVGGYS